MTGDDFVGKLSWELKVYQWAVLLEKLSRELSCAITAPVSEIWAVKVAFSSKTGLFCALCWLEYFPDNFLYAC